jgi:hypothetical protein
MSSFERSRTASRDPPIVLRSSSSCPSAERVQRLLRNAKEGMKKYSPPFIVTAWDAAESGLESLPPQVSGETAVGRVPCPMT